VSSTAAGDRNAAVVIAHHHPRGRVAMHLRNLAAALVALRARVVFVSTNAAASELAHLPPEVRAITRPNVGYDFESYRVGIQSLDDLAGIEQLVLMNTSLVFFEPAKLLRAMFAPEHRDADLLGLTASQAVAYHLQSYLVSFQNARTITSDAFRSWWQRMTPLSDRTAVIANYEIGMSRYFQAAGCRLRAVFAPDRNARFRALCRWYAGREPPERLFKGDIVSFDLRETDALNPVHFLWDDILRDFGVAKLELLARNPYHLDLAPLGERRGSDPEFARLMDDALAP
jgi:Rhamnan synthesis protein F